MEKGGSFQEGDEILFRKNDESRENSIVESNKINNLLTDGKMNSNSETKSS